MEIALFLFFVGLVLGISFYLGKKSKSESGYFAAGGQIHWAVNGIAFAGDYLSAASFLGIAGMIATLGYDGFLYSIGYLAGWIVALFVVAEPIKRLGKYTFTDALDAKFNSKGIQLTAAISTLVVSVFYLIPQMVGAGVLVTPLFGLPHYVGVLIVGAIVITIVATAGMASTTYVQFIKGGLLLVFSTILVVALLGRGLNTSPDQGGRVPYHNFKVLTGIEASPIQLDDLSYDVLDQHEIKDRNGYIVADLVKLNKDGQETWWKKENVDDNGAIVLHESQSIVAKVNGGNYINGAPESDDNQLIPVGNLESINGKSGSESETGSLNPFSFLATIGNKNTTVRLWEKAVFTNNSDKVTVYYPQFTPGSKVLRPGMKFKLEGSFLDRLDFVSLMLALFLGTSALPHILIRYYTVPTATAARKSTIVAIGAIGFFYVLTLFLGLGAMTSGVINLADNNMSAPLLARAFGGLLFAIITAIAFSTVLGTVSGLIVAASGAVAHDVMDRFFDMKMDGATKVRAGKIAAFVVGIIAIILGIVFKGMNVSFLVGLAFAVAASANLPAIVMVLFWNKTTASGVVASIIVGIIASVGLILFSPSLFGMYGLNPTQAPIPLNNPGIIAIPLSFITLVVVSLMTQKDATSKSAAV